MRLFASRKNPHIPNRNQKELIKVDLSGNQWSIEVPPASVADMSDNYHGPSINIYDQYNYSSQENLKKWQIGRYPYIPVFERSWGLFGKPWQLQELGLVTLHTMVCHAADLPSDMSCFVPEHFERVVLRHLYFTYGPGSIDIQYIAPVGWHQLNINNTPYIHCEVHHDFSSWDVWPSDGEETQISCCFYTPINKDFFLEQIFIFDGYVPAEDSLKAMRKLMEDILTSSQLKLSSENLQAQQKQAADWSKIGQPRATEEWIYPLFRAGDEDKGEKHEVLVKDGSLPPRYRLNDN